MRETSAGAKAEADAARVARMATDFIVTLSSFISAIASVVPLLASNGEGLTSSFQARIVLSQHFQPTKKNYKRLLRGGSRHRDVFFVLDFYGNSTSHTRYLQLHVGDNASTRITQYECN